MIIIIFFFYYKYFFICIIITTAREIGKNMRERETERGIERDRDREREIEKDRRISTLNELQHITVHTYKSTPSLYSPELIIKKKHQ